MTLFDPGEGDDDASPSPETPILPYAGTSGWSGSDTSRERAEHADTSGVTGERQSAVMRHLSARRARGMTWREVAEVTGWHHGTVSGALTVLHKEGHIARLTERRDRSKVYVLALYVDGRPTEAYTPNTQKPIDVQARELAELFLDYLDQRADMEAQMATWQKMLNVAANYREASS